MKKVPWIKLLYLAPALLFSWFAILSLYATNIHGTTIQQTFGSWLFVTVTILSVQAVIIGLNHRWSLAGSLSLYLAITFFSYSAIQSIVSQWFPTTLAAIIIWLMYGLLLVGLVAMTIRRPAWPSLSIFKLLSLVGLVLVIGPMITIIPNLSSSSAARQQALQATQHLPVSSSSTPASRPDIYYIILDRYASPQTQADYYDYDDQPLINFLQGNNFYLAQDSRTNYPKTLFSLSSTLNLDYLQNLVDTTSADVSDSDTASVLLRHHKTGQMLRQLGYTYYHLGNDYELASNPQVADINIMADWSDFFTTSSFTRQLLNTTYYPQLAGLLTKYPPGLGFDQHYHWADFQQQQLLNTVQQSGPKFVMAHFLMPHDPYVFDADCQLLQQPLQRWEITTVNYIEQVKCANQRAMAAIEHILKNSPQPPIIILQSDEGPEAMINPTGHHWRFDNATDIAIKERTQILNAYYFPDQDYSQLYQNITPVNSFRTVLRQYFGYDLPNLPDTTYLWPDEKHLFDFYRSPLNKQNTKQE